MSKNTKEKRSKDVGSYMKELEKVKKIMTEMLKVKKTGKKINWTLELKEKFDKAWIDFKYAYLRHERSHRQDKKSKIKKNKSSLKAH